MRRMLPIQFFAGSFLLGLLGASCVSVDPDTNEVVPRGRQRYKFEVVERNAEDLKLGMNRNEVMMLLGSPAERDESRDFWVYLPERAAVIIPGRALKLEFRDGLLVDFGYHAIVLGQRF